MVSPASAENQAPQGRLSLAQHAAAGGVLGRVEKKSEPRRGGRVLCREPCRPYGAPVNFPTLPSIPPAAPCWAKLIRPLRGWLLGTSFRACKSHRLSRNG